MSEVVTTAAAAAAADADADTVVDVTSERQIAEFIDELVVTGANHIGIWDYPTNGRISIETEDSDPTADLVYSVDNGRLTIDGSGGDDDIMMTSNASHGSIRNITQTFSGNSIRTGDGVSISTNNGKRRIRIGSINHATIIVGSTDVTAAIRDYLSEPDATRSSKRVRHEPVVATVSPVRKIVLAKGCALKKIKCSGASRIIFHTNAFSAFHHESCSLQVSGACNVSFTKVDGALHRAYYGTIDIDCSGASNVSGLSIGHVGNLEASGCSTINVTKISNARIRQKESGMSHIIVKKFRPDV